MQSWVRPQDHPIRDLIALLVVWKALLLLLSICSPGVGYDTSTSLFYTEHDHDHGEQLPLALRYIVGKLTRWDGIYFVKISRRGYLFEQEWAFGWGFTRVIALCSHVLRNFGVPDYVGLEGLVAICIAHLSHFLSVIAVFSLTRALFSNYSVTFAFKAALFHIISPAGLFLSSPYAESSCALLSFIGCLLFTNSIVHHGPNSASHDALVLLSGICFGLATTFRSNGILNGLLLLEEAFRTLLALKNGLQISVIRRLLATGLGGMCVGAGFLVPQFIAYREYCGGTTPDMRPWCQRAIPSIYTFVQDYYWNCGFLRYWTVSNLPLFLLAAPMFLILTKSGLWALSFNFSERQDQIDKGQKTGEGVAAQQVLRNLAATQLALVVLTLSTAHVQIITRISSAFPVWLWYGVLASQDGKTVLVNGFVRFMVIYALVQAGLYASFLPPA
ncbi:ER membrane glycoprotein subunit of the GPI transamidase complex-like protein [Cadophora gregata]|uniref:ER membrane glycoprotein subunit of the GPI transamidase complex-like protein n=1 Tax=Cadophora gregata TaxID=51156 RepID=UPI0026DB60C6|nr:ER membrane glycoprotein subunit of the GPI transamidase complex-like protein [Cadophora gregata]KAK0124284.1 ER membrane glycoprotein subunit of the GPI transamidase complex-like protein [Cadophora gregata]KAK0129861.1 ER membrane glycoprotein subunit of the GPI transamidase complex-like protein [Cadophora gregata f. sp. sojae]